MHVLTLLVRARTILPLYFIGLVLFAVAVVSIADRRGAGEIVPSFAIAVLLLLVAVWLTSRALTKEARRRTVVESAHAYLMKTRPEAEAEEAESTPSSGHLTPVRSTCASCAATNESDATFCKKCGTRLTTPPH